MRLAIYWAPPPGRLDDLAGRWLSGEDIGTTGLPRPQRDLVAAPARYGFHGTIKAPFRLAEGCSIATIESRMERLCASLAPVALPAMQLACDAGFVALRPVAPSEALARLALAVVRHLDDLRAPLTATEIARRRPESLSPRQRGNLDRWGYPHVAEDFRFHLTLTGPVDGAEGRAIVAALAPILQPALPRPFPIDRLCLFQQPEGGRFRQIGVWSLTGTAKG